MKPTTDDLIKLRNQGWSSHKIAKLYGLTTATVADIVSSHCRMVDIDKSPKPESNHQIAIRLYKSGVTQRAISEQIGVPTSTLGTWFSSLNILKYGSIDRTMESSDVEELE